MTEPAALGTARSARDDKIAALETRLREAEETLDAIRNGEVDAVVVSGPVGQRVYTLQSADRPYRVLVEQMQEGAVTLSVDGTILYCNQRFAALVGVEHEAPIGNTIGQFFDSAEGALFLGLLSAAGEIRSAGEFTLRPARGPAVPVNISLVDLKIEDDIPRVICGVITDLTPSRRRSQELAAAIERLAEEVEERRHAEESLQLALDASGMGIWNLDLATDGTERSLRHDQIFGHPQRVPHWGLATLLDQVVPDDRERVAAAFAEARQSGAIDLELPIRRADDAQIRWVHLKGRTYYDGGNPVRIAGVVADITDRRVMEEQLRQSQKMDAIGQLTGGVAHDFNNLLMIIGGSLDILSRRILPDAKTSPLFDAVRQGVARGAKLNQQLLAFSRRQELRETIVSIDDFIPTFQHLLDRAVSERVVLVIERCAALWRCRIDPHQLETAIVNLAINARDAMPEGGTLTLATENRIIGARAASGGGAGDYVVVSVADTGTGMLPQVSVRAFEPFFTTKPVGKGTGLGLSQVYGFAKQSGGFVTIESQPGQGTIVRIHLPRVDQPARQLPPSEAIGPGIVEGEGIVLVVEDDPDVRETTSIMLRDLGYEVRQAATARAALALLERENAIDLVFSDVIMPDGMTGLDLARELCAHRPGLPVLLVSGYTAQMTAPETLNGRLHLLHKPYTQPELSLAIQAALSGRNLPRGDWQAAL